MEKELHTFGLKHNVASLWSNIKEVSSTAAAQSSRAVIRNTNELLWKLNRPVTLLNQWLRDRHSKLREIEEKHHDNNALELEVSRMDDEGGANTYPVSQPARAGATPYNEVAV
jgi:hypothetical protein